jgi:prepilin-type N-terminal cleavage/methylation domain-containing protein
MTIKKKYGVTLMELLLVIALLAIVTPVVYPIASQALVGANDAPAMNLLKETMAHANSMGLVGRDKESMLSFKSDDSFFYCGDRKLNLPDGYKIGKIYLGAENNKTAVDETNLKFRLKGQIMAGGVYTDRVEVEVKRGNLLLASVDAYSRIVVDETMEVGSFNWGSNLPSWLSSLFGSVPWLEDLLFK